MNQKLSPEDQAMVAAGQQGNIDAYHGGKPRHRSEIDPAFLSSYDAAFKGAIHNIQARERSRRQSAMFPEPYSPAPQSPNPFANHGQAPNVDFDGFESD